MKYANIPIFVPHAACPNTCVFCNQRKIASMREPSIAEIENKLNSSLKTVDFDNTVCEIAFFGGSFTGLPYDKMTEYLKTAEKYIGKGGFSGIRMSTRPDYINIDILNILKKYNVKTIELGVQSMNDDVLAETNRGHNSEIVKQSVKLIKEFGFNLVLQMMTGLPADNDEGAIRTAKEIADLKPLAVRIYPTLVIKDTELEKLYYEGKYKPQTLDEAVNLCAELLIFFESREIEVIRLGLYADEGLCDGQIIDGPFHPAFRELCEGKIYFSLACEKIKGLSYRESIEIYVEKGAVSKMTGQKRENIIRLKSMFGIKNISVKEDGNLGKYQIEIKA